ncbi:MAG: DsbA family oxidoreductase [Cellvibrionaceae bacterium]
MVENESNYLRIDMVSDVVCPWCIIGYQKLLKALDRVKHSRPDLEVEVVFQPFELNPNMPPQGQNVNEHIAEKYGADQRTIDDNRARMREVGAELGITFNSNDQARIYNTFEAHKLLHFAHTMGLQLALKLALFDAYFSQRLDVSNREVLIELALKVGLPEDQSRAVLEGDELDSVVRAELQKYINAGVSSVPTFIFEQKYSINGAQEPQVLQQVIEQLLDAPRE